MELAVQRGGIEWLVDIGHAYMSGKGTNVDMEKAVTFYQQAAAKELAEVRRLSSFLILCSEMKVNSGENHLTKIWKQRER